ncbi:leucyl aminopeptidase [Spiroplasma syrphidicola EA-1]|uniref:Probable cytosol aminopeptidase n=1 Tax=Spiroplasma syrphidicola EA-1 TaxID=1276229 RepID=R4UJY4_9MOLU|nr:M17 family metallopeptidase [Spiroplasma syrphidicola]AGM26470.1 leucyl aminopeptidase [Spiroplasma syrphidicola EA-1]
MILLNDKNQELTLKAVFKEDELNPLIIKESNRTTLISEDKTIYAYFDKALDFKTVTKFICNFIKTNKYNVNIDIDSFKKGAQENSCVGRAIMESVFYADYEEFSLKTTKKNNVKPTINLLHNCSRAQEKFEEVKIKMELVNFARTLQDTPPNLMYPEMFANKIKEMAAGIPNLTVKILDKKEIEQEKMGLLLAVNAGSNLEPRVVVLEYKGNPSNTEKVGLIGKGITFDSGGYNLKPSNAMVGMKFDMSGAAIVCSTIIALAKQKANVNISAVACLTENRIGGKATLTESIITSMNGKTVQIDNTDAEGRLVLADGITYAIRKLNVTKLIEASTLTGAILVALGKTMTGVFANNDEWYQEFANATEHSHEEIWRMPIKAEHFEAMRKTPIADLTNAEPSRFAGSSTAAAFLCEFVEDKPYIHLDIAGTADDNNRGTGVMLKTLFEMFK